MHKSRVMDWDTLLEEYFSQRCYARKLKGAIAEWLLFSGDL